MTEPTPPGGVLYFEDEGPTAAALAQALSVPLLPIERHRFPDGELRLRLPASLPPCVILLRGLQQPNEKLIELLIAAPAARELGAQRLLLVSPYLAYMRQDVAFRPGEAVSQRHIAGLLAERFDAVVTIDPHLHRIRTLQQVMPACLAVTRSAAGLLGAWIGRQIDRPLLLGPDEESAPWVQQAAQAIAPAADHGCCQKRRDGDRSVRVSLPAQLDLRGRAVVLIDDIASTGRTLAAASQLALAAGAASVDVAVTHALFVADALADLKAAGVGRVWSTDSVPHATNAIGIVPVLAQALRDL